MYIPDGRIATLCTARAPHASLRREITQLLPQIRAAHQRHNGALQHVALCSVKLVNSPLKSDPHSNAATVRYSALQHIAVCCSILQCVAAYCSVQLDL